MSRKKVAAKTKVSKKETPARISAEPVKPRGRPRKDRSVEREVDEELEAKRAAARERARKWREERKRRQDPEGTARKEAEEKAAREAAERAATEAREKLTTAIAETVAGGVEGVAAIVQSLWFDSRRPSLGRERAIILGQIWAPVLHPYVARYLESDPQIFIAVGATFAVLSGWVSEYRAAKPDPWESDNDA